jgi:deazaflavin-dependent oxidoreductase (nitroreductase family)
MEIAELASEQYCYLTTTGRISGEPREIEIWFSLVPTPGRTTLYMISGGGQRSNWVKNLGKVPRCSVRIDGTTFSGTGRMVATGQPEDALARKLLFEKYSPGYSGSLESWARDGLPVAVDLQLNENE